jgi:hypothetical protein
MLKFFARKVMFVFLDARMIDTEDGSLKQALPNTDTMLVSPVRTNCLRALRSDEAKTYHL